MHGRLKQEMVSVGELEKLAITVFPSPLEKSSPATLHLSWGVGR